MHENLVGVGNLTPPWLRVIAPVTLLTAALALSGCAVGDSVRWGDSDRASEPAADPELMVDYCDRLEVAASKVLLGNEFAADEPGIRRDGVECGSLLVDLPGTSSGFTGLHVSVTEVRLKGGESRLEWLRHHRPKNDLEGDLERQREFDAEVWLVRGRLGDSFESATFVFTGPYMARISIGVDPEDGGLETAERLISDIRSELVRESIKILSA